MSALFRISPVRLRLVGVLAVTQVIGWGTTFDMPGVMARKMKRRSGMAEGVRVRPVSSTNSRRAAAASRRG